LIDRWCLGMLAPAGIIEQPLGRKLPNDIWRV
jgi:hypothetical protein